MEKFLRHYGRICVTLLLVATLIGVILFLNEVLLPFVLGCFLAYVLAPVISYVSKIKLGRLRFNRVVAVLLVYLVIIGSMSAGGAYLVPNLASEITQLLKELPKAFKTTSDQWLPELEERILEWTSVLPTSEELPEESLYANIESQALAQQVQSAENIEQVGSLEAVMQNYVFEIKHLDDNRMQLTPIPRTQQAAEGSGNLQLYVQNALMEIPKNIQENLVEFFRFGQMMLVRVAGSIWTVFLMLMVSGFILIDVEKVLNFTRSLVPLHYVKSHDEWIHRLDVGLNGVVRGQILICLVNGFLTMIGLLIFDVPFTVSLTIFATICSLIPVFGTILSSVPIILMGLTVSFGVAFGMLIWIFFIHALEGNILNPKIIGTAAQIHPALVFFALMSGEHIAGIPGALLAVPIFSILQNSFLFIKHTIESFEINDSELAIKSNQDSPP